MLLSLLPPILAALLLTLTLHTVTLRATAPPPPAPAPHVRIVDPELRTLFDAGLAASPTMRALVHRLEASDVVVFVHLDTQRRDGLDGSLQFVTAAADVRYLLIRVKRMPIRTRQLALLAHELQHAVEVAAAPHVVDVATFAQEYERIGHATRHRHEMRSFETRAAIAAGKRVLAELDGRDLRKPRQTYAEMVLARRAPGAPSED